LALPAAIFAALGDPRRLWLLGRLSSEGPLSISHLSADTDVSRQAITKHLEVLADAGLVRGERRGRERVFELEADRLKKVSRSLDAISSRWDHAIERLRVSVEK
jgi:DNA-binding transcriptional ArsR family regulator